MSKTYKICIIGSGHWSASMGGIEYQVNLLIEKLKLIRNTKIYFITHNVSRGFEPDGYEIIQLCIHKQLKRYTSIFDLPQIYKVLRKIKPDVIYQNGESPTISAAAVYCSRYHCRLIWHIASDSNIINKRNHMKIRQFHKNIDRKLFKYGVKHAHVIIAQTGYQANRAKGLNKKAAIEIVRNFHPTPTNVSNIEKTQKITWVANFKRLKQPEIFIALSKKLLQKNIDIQCVMIGSPDSHRKKYQNMLENEINNTPTLKWLGKQPLEVVNRHLEESILFVNTSKWEGFPNTYIQAWMRKTPVVALGCDPDNQITEFGLGLRSGSFEQLIEDVIFLINSDEKRVAMGERSRQFALKNYSFKNLEKLCNIILNCDRKDCAL